MANPQLENGYTPIANEILEALIRLRIPGEARQVLDVILRKTYGYHKSVDRISLSQFCLSTGLRKPTVCRALLKLQQMNLVIKKDNAKGTEYRFNKDFDKWKPLSKRIIVIKKDNLNVIKKGTDKRKNIYTITKDNIGAKAPELPFNSEEYIEEMIKNPRRDIHIIGLFWKFKGFKLPNKEAAGAELKRNLKAAKALVGYGDRELLDTMDYIDNDGKRDYVWTLETVGKRVLNVVNNRT